MLRHVLPSLLVLLFVAPTTLGIDGTDPAAPFLRAAADHPDKVPASYAHDLGHTLRDGTVRAIIAMEHRDAAVEAAVAGLTGVHAWYGSTPNLIALVTADEAAALLDRDDVRFLEPDTPLAYFASQSTVSVHARSVGATGAGVWSYDAATDSLVSDHSHFTTRAVTGEGVTLSIVDSGIDQTHRDFDVWGCARTLPYVPCDSRVLYAGKAESTYRSFFTGTLLDAVDDLFLALYQEDVPLTTEAVSGHGSHVAGIAAGNAANTRMFGADPARYGSDGHVFGVAPEADLVSISNGDSIWAGLATGALAWTLEHVNDFDIQVSSNSWGCLGGCGYNPSSALSGILRDLYRAGVVTTFAVGNDGGNAGGGSFSGYAQSPYVLGVANHDDATGRLSSSSSRGASANDGLPAASTWDPDTEAGGGYGATGGGFRRPDLSAPGTDIWAARTLTGGTSAGAPRANTFDAGVNVGGFVPYAIMSGTSMATPHVAGAAALLFDACPGASNLDVMRALVGNTQTVLDTSGGTGDGWEVGYGGLDVRAALDWLVGQLGVAGCPR